MQNALALEMFLPYRLAVTAAVVSRSLSAVYEQRFGVSIAEWRILANLGRFGSLTAGAIAEHSTLDKPKVTRALQRLKVRRLVSRKKGRQDRREVMITLTAEGERIYQEIATLARVWEADLLDTLSVTERAALLQLLCKLEICAHRRISDTGVSG
jgi:DNA-binding MarR family transcriptional regulator